MYDNFYFNLEGNYGGCVYISEQMELGFCRMGAHILFDLDIIYAH